MAKPNKTQATETSVAGFLASVPEAARQDSTKLIELMQQATGCEPRMWGPSIIGFDTFRYPFANGKTGEICLIGFSPRKANLVLYITQDHAGNADLFEKLGKYKTGKACIYANQLSDLHQPTLLKLLQRAVKARRAESL